MTARPAPSTVSADLRGLLAEGLMTGAGILASLATVALNLSLKRWLDFDLLSLTLVVIIPAGALYGGLASASGYYLAARATHTLPNRRTLFEMVAIALSTWFLAHWATYALLRFPNGALVRDVVSFWDYFRVRTEHLQLSFERAGGSRTGDGTPLGMLGYAAELLQVAGFVCGGLLLWLGLKQAEACAPCGRFAKSKQLLKRATSQLFDDVLRRASIALPALADQVRTAVGARRLIGMNLRLVECPACHRHWIRPAVVVMSGNQPFESKLASHDIEARQAALLHQVAPEGN